MDLEIDESPLFEARDRIAEIFDAREADPEKVRKMLAAIRTEAQQALEARQANYTAALQKFG